MGRIRHRYRYEIIVLFLERRTAGGKPLSLVVNLKPIPQSTYGHDGFYDDIWDKAGQDISRHLGDAFTVWVSVSNFREISNQVKSREGKS